MPPIQQLSPHVADLIAAGEVVERPASVVKELVENAIDAGSSAIVVELRRGGMSLIRVTDNGCGIPARELPTAFLRHATSKLRHAEDLSSIGTLGFRGEALAAISAVSRVEITSRPHGQNAAVFTLEGGVPGEVEETGAPEGTTIAVRDLFYNTPARLKFMKKDSAETAAVAGLIQHLALSHPNISFKFLKDGMDALHTPGDGRLDSAIYAALGRDFAKTLIPIQGRSGDTAVSGFITQPLQHRGSRSMQVFFVNGRFIKSQLLTAALEEGYRNRLMKGKFPGCVLSVTLPATSVDVNVHPAKTQVKFAKDGEVFDAVYHTVLDALESGGGPAPKPAETLAAPRQDFFQSMDAKTYREQKALSKPESPPARRESRESVVRVSDSAPEFLYQTAARPAPLPKGGAFSSPPSVIPRKPAPTESAVPADPLPPERTASPAPPEAGIFQQPAAPKPENPAISPVATVPAPPLPPAIPQAAEEQQAIEPIREPSWRIAGEVLHTYVICESGDGCVYLIDKHAAHERINFNRLLASQEPPMRQTLLQATAVELGREDKALLLENLPLLESLGFACEDFGGGAILVREVPADIDAGDAASTLEELAGALRAKRSPAERREALLHTMACKAAIKGGWTSDVSELRALVEKVQSGEVCFCPHGRPVAVKFTKYQLEKMFKRA